MRQGVRIHAGHARQSFPRSDPDPGFAGKQRFVTGKKIAVKLGLACIGLQRQAQRQRAPVRLRNFRRALNCNRLTVQTQRTVQPCRCILPKAGKGQINPGYQRRILLALSKEIEPLRISISTVGKRMGRRRLVRGSSSATSIERALPAVLALAFACSMETSRADPALRLPPSFPIVIEGSSKTTFVKTSRPCMREAASAEARMRPARIDSLCYRHYPMADAR